MRIIFSVFLILTVSSCTINLSRNYDHNSINLEETEFDMLRSLDSDTILTVRSADCQVGSNDYLFIIYPEKGNTKSIAYSSYGKYPLIKQQYYFDWEKIYSSLDKIQTEKTKPSFYASVIEGDTTWTNTSGVVSGERLWTFTLYHKQKKNSWTSDAHTDYTNPSLTRTVVSKYILTETYHLISYQSSPYGNLEPKFLPIVSFNKRR